MIRHSEYKYNEEGLCIETKRSSGVFYKTDYIYDFNDRIIKIQKRDFHYLLVSYNSLGLIDTINLNDESYRVYEYYENKKLKNEFFTTGNRTSVNKNYTYSKNEEIITTTYFLQINNKIDTSVEYKTNYYNNDTIFIRQIEKINESDGYVTAEMDIDYDKFMRIKKITEVLDKEPDVFFNTYYDYDLDGNLISIDTFENATLISKTTFNYVFYK